MACRRSVEVLCELFERLATCSHGVHFGHEIGNLVLESVEERHVDSVVGRGCLGGRVAETGFGLATGHLEIRVFLQFQFELLLPQFTRLLGGIFVSKVFALWMCTARNWTTQQESVERKRLTISPVMFGLESISEVLGSVVGWSGF
jgi:hypothetical protein